MKYTTVFLAMLVLDGMCLYKDGNVFLRLNKVSLKEKDEKKDEKD